MLRERRTTFPHAGASLTDMKREFHMKQESVRITTEFIKLDSFLKFCGAAETGGEGHNQSKDKSVAFHCVSS